MEALLLLAALALAWLVGLLTLTWVMPGLLVALLSNAAAGSADRRSGH
jgi:hypothetical protein